MNALVQVPDPLWGLAGAQDLDCYLLVLHAGAYQGHLFLAQIDQGLPVGEIPSFGPPVDIVITVREVGPHELLGFFRACGFKFGTRPLYEPPFFASTIDERT